MTTRPTAGADPLERILPLAGRREPVDSKRTERVERQTHERWQRMLARRRAADRRRRISWIGGGVAVAASLLAAVLVIPRLVPQAPVVATVVTVLGSPETGARGRAMMRLATGAELQAGSVLQTAAAEGVALALRSGHQLRLADATRVRVETDAVVLDAGAVYVDSGGDATPIEVRSSLATVRELGTQYIARLAGGMLQVSVREGAVRVAHGTTADTANAGEMLQLDASGRTSKKPIASHGEHWAWVARLASVPDLQDLKLAEFLGWVAREQGWRLEFASAEDARAAAGVELFGSIEGLSAEESLATVMSSTGWRYVLADGALTVDSGRAEQP